MSTKKTKLELEAELGDLQQELKARDDLLAEAQDEICDLKAQAESKAKFISTADLRGVKTRLQPSSGGMIITGGDGNPKVIPSGRKR